MKLKLKSSVLLKPVNPNCVYALDCASPEEVFYKFEDVSKIFIENIFKGIERSELLNEVKKIYSTATDEQISNDLDDFLATIEGYDLLDKA